MASTSTGEMFTQEQVDAMTVEERARHGLVAITPEDEALMEGMTEPERVEYLKNNKGLADQFRDQIDNMIPTDFDPAVRQQKKDRKEKLKLFRQKKLVERNRRKEKNRRKVNRGRR